MISELPRVSRHTHAFWVRRSLSAGLALPIVLSSPGSR